MRRYFLFLLLTLPVFATCPNTGNGYSYCYELAVGADEITGTGTITDVMWFVLDEDWLETAANGGLVESLSGSTPYDIRIESSAAALLPYFIAAWDGSDTAGTLRLAVRAAWDGTNGTSIYLYVGKSGLGASDQSQTDTFQDYVFYAGLDQSVSASADHYIDWSAGGSHQTMATTTGAASIAGKVGSAIDFDGTNTVMADSTPHTSVSITGDVTLCAYIRPDADGDRKVLSTITNSTSDGGYMMGIYGSPANVEGEIWSNPAGAGVGLRSGATGTPVNLSAGTWYHVCLRYSNSGDVISSVVDGVLDRTKATAVTLGVPATKAIGVGYSTSHPTLFKFSGGIDNAFVRAAYLSENVLSTLKINQSAPTKTNWFTLGAQDTPGGPASPSFRVPSIIGAILMWREEWLPDSWRR